MASSSPSLLGARKIFSKLLREWVNTEPRQARGARGGQCPSRKSFALPTHETALQSLGEIPRTGPFVRAHQYDSANAPYACIPEIIHDAAALRFRCYSGR